MVPESKDRLGQGHLRKVPLSSLGAQTLVPRRLPPRDGLAGIGGRPEATVATGTRPTGPQPRPFPGSFWPLEERDLFRAVGVNYLTRTENVPLSGEGRRGMGRGFVHLNLRLCFLPVSLEGHPGRWLEAESVGSPRPCLLAPPPSTSLLRPHLASAALSVTSSSPAPRLRLHPLHPVPIPPGPLQLRGPWLAALSPCQPLPAPARPGCVPHSCHVSSVVSAAPGGMPGTQ